MVKLSGVFRRCSDFRKETIRKSHGPVLNREPVFKMPIFAVNIMYCRKVQGDGIVGELLIVSTLECGMTVPRVMWGRESLHRIGLRAWRLHGPRVHVNVASGLVITFVNR